MYQLEKVDTEKIFQLNIFSKVDTSAKPKKDGDQE